MLRVWVFAEAFGCLEFSFSRFNKECKKHICRWVGAEYFCFLKFVWVVLCSTRWGPEPSAFWSVSAPEPACKLTGDAVMNASGLGCSLCWHGKRLPPPPPQAPVTVLLMGSAFYFPFCVYFRIFHSLVFLWVFPSDLFFFFLFIFLLVE